jgi:hypothetical protein
MPNELQKMEAMPVSRPVNFDIESIFRLAIDKQGTAETLEKLMGIRREINAEASKRGFDESMAALQSEMPIIVKRKSGAKNAYRYAPLDDIVAQVQPLLLKHGFSFTVTSQVEQGWVKALCKITHRDGHSDCSEFKCPVDMRNPMMNDPQRYAGSLTFCKRYAFCNAFGILTGDEDRDGHGEPVKPSGPAVVSVESAPKHNKIVQATKEQKQELWDATKSIHFGQMPKLRQWLIDELNFDPARDLEDVGAAEMTILTKLATKKLSHV